MMISADLPRRVRSGGPAAKANIREGDLILRYKHQQVRGPADLAEQVGATPVGQRVQVDLYRGPKRLTVSATIDRRQVSRIGWMRGGAILWRGMRLANLTPDSRLRMNADVNATGVVVIDVLEKSPAGRARVRIGDVIEQVGEAPVNDIVGFRRRVSSQAGMVAIAVRGRGTLKVPP